MLLWEPSAELGGQCQVVNAGDTGACELHGAGSRHRASCMLKVLLTGVNSWTINYHLFGVLHIIHSGDRNLDPVAEFFHGAGTWVRMN